MHILVPLSSLIALVAAQGSSTATATAPASSPAAPSPSALPACVIACAATAAASAGCGLSVPIIRIPPSCISLTRTPPPLQNRRDVPLHQHGIPAGVHPMHHLDLLARRTVPRGAVRGGPMCRV